MSSVALPDPELTVLLSMALRKVGLSVRIFSLESCTSEACFYSVAPLVVCPSFASSLSVEEMCSRVVLVSLRFSRVSVIVFDLSPLFHYCLDPFVVPEPYHLIDSALPFLLVVRLFVLAFLLIQMV